MKSRKGARAGARKAAVKKSKNAKAAAKLQLSHAAQVSPFLSQLPPEHSKEEIAHVAALLMQSEQYAADAIASAVDLLDAAAEAVKKRFFERQWMESESDPPRQISFEEGVKRITGDTKHRGRALKTYRVFWQWWRWSLGKNSMADPLPQEKTSDGKAATAEQKKRMQDESWHQHQEMHWDPVILHATSAAFADWRRLGSPCTGRLSNFDLRRRRSAPPARFTEDSRVAGPSGISHEPEKSSETENKSQSA